MNHFRIRWRTDLFAFDNRQMSKLTFLYSSDKFFHNFRGETAHGMGHIHAFFGKFLDNFERFPRIYPRMAQSFFARSFGARVLLVGSLLFVGDARPKHASMSLRVWRSFRNHFLKSFQVYVPIANKKVLGMIVLSVVIGNNFSKVRSLNVEKRYWSQTRT